MNRPSPPPEAAKLIEAALDVFVYAPIGFVLEAREVVPKLAERGRGQVTLARLFGRYAIQLGQAEAERVLNRQRAATTEPAGDAAHATARAGREQAAAETASAAAAATSASDAPAASEAPVSSDADGPKAATSTTSDEAATPSSSDAPAAAVPTADDLPIPGYDALSASQVVPRLDALLPHELEAVRAYESAHRGRRTILNRIAQRLA